MQQCNNIKENKSWGEIKRGIEGRGQWERAERGQQPGYLVTSQEAANGEKDIR